MKEDTNPNEAQINLSYITLRKLIGWLGLLLPLLVYMIELRYEPSISDYYYTKSGVLFTSVTTLLGAFLISYKGYKQKPDEWFSDNLVTWVGGILIIIVAAIPTVYKGSECCPTPICYTQNDVLRYIHFGSAVLFFIVMGYMSAIHFVRGIEPFDAIKMRQNMIYRIAGFGMWLVILVAGVLIVAFDIQERFTHLIFWVEVLLLVLFGTSWLVKSKALTKFGL